MIDFLNNLLIDEKNIRDIHFRDRALYYHSRTISHQGERGADWQFSMKAVYGVFSTAISQATGLTQEEIENSI